MYSDKRKYPGLQQGAWRHSYGNSITNDIYDGNCYKGEQSLSNILKLGLNKHIFSILNTIYCPL